MTDAEHDLACLLRWAVNGNDRDGYQVPGVWFKAAPFQTRREAERRLLDFVRTRYVPSAASPSEPRR